MVGSHRQPGSAEVLLGRRLHGQPPAVIDSRYKIRAAVPIFPISPTMVLLSMIFPIDDCP
jgi:hypothetical protein